MLSFVALFGFVLAAFYLLFSGKKLTFLELTATAIFCTLLLLSYAPQISNLLLGTLQLHALLSVCVVALAVAFIPARKHLDPARPAGDFRAAGTALLTELRASPYLITLLSIALLASTFAAVLIYKYSNFGWDGWSYHSSALAWFNQQDRFVPMPLDELILSYPKNIEMIGLWIFKLAGNDQFIDSVNLIIHWLVLPFAYGVGRHIGLSRKWALAASLIYFSTPILIEQTWSTFIDQAFADCLVMTLYFYFCWYQHRNEQGLLWSILLGLSLGNLAQIKGTGLYVIFIVGTLLVVREILEGRLKTLIQPLMVIAVTTAIAGAGWYLQTWYFYGNPFYPYRLLIPGTDDVLFNGPYDLKQSLLKNYSTKKNLNLPTWQLYLKEFTSTNWGLHYLFLGLPAMAIGIVKGNIHIRWLLAFVVLYFILVPLSFVDRYAAIATFTAAVCFSFMAQYILNSRVWLPFLASFSVVLIVISLIPQLRSAFPDNLPDAGYATPPDKTTEGFQRFALVNRAGNAHIGLVSIEQQKADNPYWYFYFGPRWNNRVEAYDPLNVDSYDFVICGRSSGKCDSLGLLDSHRLALVEKNVEVYEKR